MSPVVGGSGPQSTNEPSTTPSVRGTYAKTEARRQTILDAAVEVFADGFRSGSLRHVAERAGISQTGLLHHFPTKDSLVSAVLVRRDEDVRRHFGDGATGLAALRAVIAVTKHNQRTPELVQLHTSLSAEATAPDHPAHQHFLRRYAWIVGHFRDAFEAVAADGQLRPGVDPARAARGLCAALDGLQVQWLYARNSVDMVAEVRAHLQSLVTVPL